MDKVPNAVDWYELELPTPRRSKELEMGWVHGGNIKAIDEWSIRHITNTTKQSYNRQIVDK